MARRAEHLDLRRPRQGQAFNDLVAALERALIDSEVAQLEKNARRRDRDTGHLREHDVVITWKQGHHRITTAIECRDRNRPVGVPDVEAFAHKCERTGIDHKIIVSSTGFRQSAQMKAEALGVSLMELRQVSEFDWCEMQFWLEDRREFIGFKATVFFVNDNRPSNQFALFDIARNEVTPDLLQATLVNAVSVPPADNGEVDAFIPIRFRVDTQDWIAKDKHGQEFPVSYILADGGYTTRRTLRPVTLQRYAGQHGCYDVASADAIIGNSKGKMIMIHDETGTRVLWSAL